MKHAKTPTTIISDIWSCVADFSDYITLLSIMRVEKSSHQATAWTTFHGKERMCNAFFKSPHKFRILQREYARRGIYHYGYKENGKIGFMSGILANEDIWNALRLSFCQWDLLVNLLFRHTKDGASSELFENAPELPIPEFDTCVFVQGDPHEGGATKGVWLINGAHELECKYSDMKRNYEKRAGTCIFCGTYCSSNAVYRNVNVPNDACYTVGNFNKKRHSYPSVQEGLLACSDCDEKYIGDLYYNFRFPDIDDVFIVDY
jgi:hypothetical protein